MTLYLHRDRSQSCQSVNRTEARYKIHDRIKQRQLEQKGALKAMRNMVKGWLKVFQNVVKDVYQYLPPSGESGSEISHFIPEHRKFAEVTKFSDYKKKPWLKETLKEIKNLINKS